MVVTLLANLPKSFVRDMLVLGFLFGGEIRLSNDLEERFFFDPFGWPDVLRDSSGVRSEATCSGV